MAKIISVNVGTSSMVGTRVRRDSDTVRINTGTNTAESVHINPGTITVIGRSPYINEETQTWMVWDDVTRQYVDTGVVADGTIRDVTDDFYIDDGTLGLNGENAAAEIGLGLSTYADINNLFK